MKQAVVLIHGVGEQIPMDTLRGFVEAVWSDDPTLRRPKVPATVWSKPDTMSGDLELRRITTAENRERRRTDFFEFYWAHLMRQTTWGHVRAWLRMLLFRSPRRVPPQLRALWWSVVGLLATAAFVALAHATGLLRLPAIPLASLGVAWFLVGGAVVTLFLRVAGDAARYLHVAPDNIEVRRHIRQAGLALLDRLHESGEYDRILVVGHSLGSVIGYDLLTHYWARVHHHPGGTGQSSFEEKFALEKLETLAALALSDPARFDADEFQRAQSDYFAQLRRRAHPWLVSDFVTLGSPLAHASYLLARGEAELRRKIAERELPSCPPALEPILGELRFSYPCAELRLPHHAAPFSATRWTNLYFPCRRTLWGDVIGGPVAPAFGPGVKDIPVETTLRGNLFSHTLYWNFPSPRPAPDAPAPWIAALRRALRLVQTEPPAPAASSPAVKSSAVSPSTANTPAF